MGVPFIHCAVYSVLNADELLCGVVIFMLSIIIAVFFIF